MYFDEPSVPTRLKEPVPLVAVLLASTALIIVIGLYPGPILNYLYQVAAYLSPGITGLAG